MTQLFQIAARLFWTMVMLMFGFLFLFTDWEWSGDIADSIWDVRLRRRMGIHEGKPNEGAAGSETRAQ